MRILLVAAVSVALGCKESPRAGTTAPIDAAAMATDAAAPVEPPEDRRRWCTANLCARGPAACEKLRAESDRALPPCELPIVYCFAVEDGQGMCYDSPNSCNVMRVQMLKYPQPGKGKPTRGCDRVDTATVPMR